jgi:hypothetical protein
VAYELFKRSAVRVETPTLALAPQGRIAINAAACRLLTEAGIRAVTILWDKANHRMAIRGATKTEKNSYAISFTGNRHSGSLAAKLFLRHIGWTATKRETLRATWNPLEKMLEATLPPQYVGVRTPAGKERRK